MLSSNSCIAKHKNSVSEKFGDEIAVLLTENMKVYKLGTTAAEVWDTIDGKKTLGDIIAQIREEIEIDEDTLEKEILHLANKLLTLGLVSVVA